MDHLSSVCELLCIPVKSVGKKLESNLDVGLSNSSAKKRLKSAGSTILLPSTGSLPWNRSSPAARLAAMSSGKTGSVQVIRDGAKKLVPQKNLVPGDVITLGEGDRVPADARILECAGDCAIALSPTADSIDATTANALILGSRSPVAPEVPGSTGVKAKKALAGLSLEAKQNLVLSAANALWFGTFISSGSCEAVVLATGANTLLAQLAKAAEATEETTSESEEESQSYVEGSGREEGSGPGEDPADGADPADAEEAPSAAEPAPVDPMAVGVKLMTKLSRAGKVLCKTPDTRLGAVKTVIVSEGGLGFLTKGNFSVESVCDGDETNDAHFRKAMLLATQRAQVVGGKVMGDPMEVAALTHAAKEVEGGLAEVQATRDAHTVSCKWPFSSELKYSAVVVRNPDAAVDKKKQSTKKKHRSSVDASKPVAAVLYAVGVDREIRQRAVAHAAGFKVAHKKSGGDSNGAKSQGSMVEKLLDANSKDLEGWTAVLSFACRELSLEEALQFEDGDEEELRDATNLVPLGHVCLLDEPHDESAVSAITEAGIALVLATDFATVHEAKARLASLPIPMDAQVTLVNLAEEESEDELHRTLKRAKGVVICLNAGSSAARVRLVHAAQRKDAAVAFAGSSIADVAPMQAADIGCALGHAPSAVQDAADAILLRSHPADLAEGVTAVRRQARRAEGGAAEGGACTIM